jgi:hypothetical protein
MPNYQAGKLSDVATAVQGVASAVAQFPSAAPIAAPIAFVAGLASRVLSALGFTRHTKIEAPAHIKHMPGSNIVNVDGFDTGEIIALTGANTLSLEGLGGADSFDNMTFEHLFPRPTLVEQFTWATTDATTTRFQSIGVTPFWCLNTGTVYHCQVAGYVGIPFTFWRGTMHYEIVISASALMRGTLQVFWCPDTLLPAAALDVTNLMYNMICDIESNMTCRFTVGYSGRKPMLRNVLLNSGAFNNAFNFHYCNGYIGFKVINPLTSMSGAASVNVSVFAWADSDMRFALPRDFIPALQTTPTVDVPFHTAINYQSGMMGKTLGSTARVVEETTLVPVSEPFSIADALSGEDIFSVRPLLQKFSRFYYPAFPDSGVLIRALGCANYLDHFGTTRSNLLGNGDNPSGLYPYAGGDVASFNWFRHYAFLYDSMAGSTRYKVYAAATDGPPVTADQPMQTYPILSTGEIYGPTEGIAVLVEPTVPLMNDFTTVEPRNLTESTEFTIPYYNNTYSQACRVLLNNDTLAHIQGNARSGCRIDRITYRDTKWPGVMLYPPSFLTAQIFTAGGPDSKFNTFRRVPAIIGRSTNAFPPDIISWVTQ